MPIDIDPTTIQVPTTQQAQADKLYAKRIVIDATDLPASDAEADTKPPKITIVMTPYSVAPDGTRTYAAADETVESGNAYALAAVVAEVGMAEFAIFAAVPAVRRRKLLNLAALAGAQDAIAPAKATVAAANTAWLAAGEAYTEAFTARNLIADQTSPDWQSAQAATQAAKQALDARLDALNTAREALAVAQARVEAASAAVADPANPPLAPEAQT